MSLVGFSARNHPQQATRDDVDDRRTRREFFDPLHAVHRFTVDAAASDENALLPHYWTRDAGGGGLAESWALHRVWCNPPYSDIRPWVEKASLEIATGCDLVVMLLPANRTEQGWWQEFVEPYRDRRPELRWWSLATRFLPGRMRFDWPANREVPAKGDRPPFGCVLLTWRVDL